MPKGPTASDTLSRKRHEAPSLMTRVHHQNSQQKQSPLHRLSSDADMHARAPIRYTHARINKCKKFKNTRLRSKSCSICYIIIITWLSTSEYRLLRGYMFSFIKYIWSRWSYQNDTWVNLHYTIAWQESYLYLSQRRQQEWGIYLVLKGHSSKGWAGSGREGANCWRGSS